MSKPIVTQYMETRYAHMEEVLDNKFILGKVRAIASKADERTYNGTVYTTDFWNYIFNSDKFKAKLERRLVLGNLDHPKDPSQKGRDAACIATKCWLEGQEVWVEFDILNTTDGKTLWVLLNAGVILGVSSRGTGEDKMVGGNVMVIAESFDLKGWDFVCDESAFGAMFKGFTEEKKKYFSESIATIDKSKAGEVYASVLKVIEESKKEDLVSKYQTESLRLSLENQKLKKEVLVYKNMMEAKSNEISAVSKTKAMFETKTESLAQSKVFLESTIKALEENVSSLKKDVTNYAEEKNYYESKLKEKDSIISSLKNKPSNSIEISVNKTIIEGKKEENVEGSVQNSFYETKAKTKANTVQKGV